jgi:membrane-bound lytic murein transglycosylase B
VAEQVSDSLPKNSPLLTGELKPTLTVNDYWQAGINPKTDVPGDAKARAIRLLGEEGSELWLTYHNFYVITRYNHSHLYAMAVHQLAGALEERMRPLANENNGDSNSS